MRGKVLFAAVLAFAAATGLAAADDLTDDEILERFLIQRDAFKAVKTGKGATRGLKIVSVDELDEAPVESGAATETATVEPLKPDSSTTETATVEPLKPDTGSTATEAVTVTAEPDQKPVEERVELAAAEVGLLPEELQVNVRIRFDFDSALIPADQMPVIEQMCRVIKASDIGLFRIMGHTDASGSDAYNEELSRSRAEEVKRRLVSDCGIDETRLDAMGLGERFLADPEDPKAPENRRVEFQALS